MCDQRSVWVSNDFHDELLATAYDLARLQHETFLSSHERRFFRIWWCRIRPSAVKSHIRTLADLKSYRFPPLPNRYGSGVRRARRLLAGSFYLTHALKTRIDGLRTDPSHVIIRSSDLHKQWLEIGAVIEQLRERIAKMNADQGHSLLFWHNSLSETTATQLASEIILSVPRPPLKYPVNTYMEDAIHETFRTRRFLCDLIGSPAQLEDLCNGLRLRYLDSIDNDAVLNMQNGLLI